MLGWQGKGEGELQLKITYFPFELLYSKPRDASLVRPSHRCSLLCCHAATSCLFSLTRYAQRAYLLSALCPCTPHALPYNMP